MTKRTDYLSWDEYFMGIALLSAKRSKDPNTQVGACIVSEKNKIMSVGYNGFPRGCSDDEFPWARVSVTGDDTDTKYPYVCHAELNAILNNRGADLDGCRIYVPLFPCNECAKAIIQTGIKEVIYLSDKYDGTPMNVASKKMLSAAGVVYRQIEFPITQFTLSFRAEDV
ncbi:MAG: dCMP deaminase family protein [Clostridia bacterium]|nr:dCMP deaminase family protein [Clostridia bacterium]